MKMENVELKTAEEIKEIARNAKFRNEQKENNLLIIVKFIMEQIEENAKQGKNHTKIFIYDSEDKNPAMLSGEEIFRMRNDLYDVFTKRLRFCFFAEDYCQQWKKSTGKYGYFSFSTM